MAPPCAFGGFFSHSRSCCSAGALFLVLPWVSSVVPTPPWLLPGPSVHVTVPCTRSQLSGSGAARATGTKTLMAKRAATINIIMRLIKIFPFSGYQHTTLVACLPVGRLGV